jgi:hypothetical protein
MFNKPFVKDIEHFGKKALAVFSVKKNRPKSQNFEVLA